MLLQHVDGRILLLPAWPTAWNTSFKLHAPGNTTITGEFRAGKVEKLEVTPASRVNDIVLMPTVPVSATGSTTGSTTVSSYDAWRMVRYRGDANTDPAVWAPLGDIDRNGISNLMEFATGGDPTVATDNGIAPSGLWQIANGDALAMTIAVPNAATFAPGSDGAMTASIGGLTYRIEGSEDLNAWTRPIEEVTPAHVAGVPVAPPAGHRYRSFRIAAGAPASVRDFIRLRVVAF
jgi:hypothetical protein